MMKKTKRIVASIMLTATVLSQAMLTNAASVNFGKFTWTTTPGDEALFKAVSKKKADNESNWYIRITEQKGLSKSTGTNKNGRALAYSAIGSTMSAPRALFSDYKGKSLCQAYTNKKIAKKGAVGTLYLGGNSNNKKKYNITLAGKYTS